MAALEAAIQWQRLHRLRNGWPGRSPAMMIGCERRVGSLLMDLVLGLVQRFQRRLHGVEFGAEACPITGLQLG